jgi:CRP/FNR family transcriptional regulator
MNRSHLADFRQTALINTLRACELFAELPVEDLRRVVAVSVLKDFDKGDYLFREGDSPLGFYVIQQGSVNVHRMNAAGREQVIHVFRAGESFAEATLTMPGGCPANARALEPSQVLLVQRAGFVELLRQRPEFALLLLGSLSQRVRVLVAQLDDLTLKDVESRLANWLLKRCPDRDSEEPVTVRLGLAKRDLAAELGTVSETLSRTLAKLRTQKLLKIQGRTITVLSPAGLLRLLHRNLGE